MKNITTTPPAPAQSVAASQGTPTPGPWVAVDLDGKHYAVAEQSTGIGLLYNGANARLIAAAPELLAALRETIRQFPARDKMHTLQRVAFDDAIAAIAKATRGAQ